jgi:DinB superfamily
VAPNRELLAASGFICRSVDRVIACLDGMPEDELNWRPPVPGANSLYAIAVHLMANTEENILGMHCGDPESAARDDVAHNAEWTARGSDATAVAMEWMRLRQQIEAALSILPSSELERERDHPRRGRLTGRDILYVVARHGAEHQGQAELTRDLVRATR